MKSMGNDDNGSNSNWLGFSLSSHIKMEAPQTQQPPTSAVTPAVPLGFFNSQPHLNYGLYYGAGETHNASGFYPHFPVMPLKSDGSLCLMEALNRTTQQPQQAMFSSSTPKLEDFFGGSTMGAHDYGSSEREAMALSLDSMYYHHQQQNTESAQNCHNCLTQLQHNSRQINHQVPPQQQQQQQQLQYYSGVKNYELLLADEAKESNSTHLQKMISCIGDNGGEAAGGGSVGAMGYGDLQCLSLSMSPGSQSSCVTGSHQISPAGHDCSAMETKKRGAEKVDQKQIVHRKSIDTFGQRTSQYRGVTRHRWTGRYEAHLWDNSCKKEGQSRKGRQVYLGGYDMEEKAARAYDLAALKYWGPSTHINFPLENYQNELEEMKNMTRQEYVAHLRRKSSGFSRGASIYRGVTRHHQHGRWQARIGRVAGNKDLYLGTFSTQEEAAEAYDIAAIKFRGVNAVTNFDISRYDVERIMASNTLLAGELARRDKEICPNENISAGETVIPPKNNVTGTEADWKMVLYQSSQQLEHRQANAVGNYKNQSFSLAPENVVGIGAMSSVHEAVEGSNKMEAHMSNASSLVTSLSSSREGSPDKNSLSMLFAVPAAGTNKLIASPASNVNTWNIPSAQLRPALTIPQMPVFAAWTDA